MAKPLDAKTLQGITHHTVDSYSQRAQDFWLGTRDHDVSQNLDALCEALGPGSHRILDLGCGPGRDLVALRDRGHQPTGLDGCAAFCAMARDHAQRPVLHQDFLALDLPTAGFDGIFANATLFHVPTQELPRVLIELHDALKPSGVLFCSNPRGNNQEGWNGDRYGAYHDLSRWTKLTANAGFSLLQHYYRPPGKPRDQQPWLATVLQRD